MTKKEALVFLCSFIPFGPARIKLLISYFDSPQEVLRAKKKDLTKLGLGEKRVLDFLIYREKFDIKDYFNRLKRYAISYLTIYDKNYPANLKGIADAPYVIYLKGKIISSDSNAVAIVGSRKVTSYGKEVAEKFAGELAGVGVTIVSGLARGVDTVAHKSALGVGGRTIAVLGCGLDSVYPPENTKLAGDIAKSGAVISEYPLGHPALPINFASRNRIVSGISKAVVVVEGAEKSGTLLTASHAANQGRSVFAVPGQITSPLSAAPFYLIKNGAIMATSPKDVLDELNLELTVDRGAVEKIMPSGKGEEEILAILENEPMHLDEIARIYSLEIQDISARLTIMELKGLVKNLGGGIYKKI